MDGKCAIFDIIVAAHESEDNSNHVVVLPRSIKTARLQVM